MKFAGVFTVTQTPLTEKDQVAEQMFEREIEWLIECGVDGVMLAMVSEVCVLAPKSTTASGRLFSGFCAAAFHWLQVLELKALPSQPRFRGGHRTTASIAALGAAIAHFPSEISKYYVATIESASCQVVVQDASDYLGQPLDVSLYVDLIDAYGEKRVHFKPEAKPVKEHLGAQNNRGGGRARVFEGPGGADLLDIFLIGIVGTMPGAKIWWALVAFWQALTVDDWKRARVIHAPLLKLVSF